MKRDIQRIADLPTSEVRWLGKEVERVEDPALVTGRAQFVDDLAFPGMLHCAILRSPLAHARITAIRSEAALKLPGVVAIVTGEEVLEWTQPSGAYPEGTGAYCMATDKASYVGEPVAAVAAASRYVAEDALELIEVDYEPLTPVANVFAAMEPDSPKVIEEQASNVVLQKRLTWGEVDRAFEEADHVFTESFRWNRVGANPMETFGTITEWCGVTGTLTCHAAAQSPGLTALAVAGVLGIPSNKVRLISQQRGGSFGGKGNPRGINISALLSRKAGGRPVKWIEDRSEYLMAGGSQAWDRHYEVSLALKADGEMTGLRVKLIDDIGASGENFGSVGTAKPLSCFTECYAIPVAEYDVTIVLTNKLPTSAYRGMGPPPHNTVLEQMVDVAARGLEIDPAEIRRRNYIPPESFPYIIPSGNEYDSGDYEATLDAVLELARYPELREEQSAARKQGRLVGIGVANGIEPGIFDWNAYAMVGMPNVGVPEGATVSIDVFGKITVRVGFTSEGQGQYTLAAQLLADYFGTEMGDISVVPLDTLSAPPHFGPGGSRLGVALTGAILGACKKLEAKLVQLASGLLQAPAENVELFDGMLRVKGVPGAEMALADVAGVALGRSDLLPPGMEPGLEATHVWTASGRNPVDELQRAKSYLTAANACHVVLVEIDRETGQTEILKYFIGDDCGTRLNPVSVEGMTHGGMAQGVGAALLEEYPFDEDAQPLATTFMDYLVPTVNEIPRIESVELVTPSPFSPLGAKGCGEGAIHTAPAAVLCAINDALAPLDVVATEVPASPHRLWRLLREARDAQ
ncbi:MAG: xanthine dehydrogenase family protein molybdopterin-binding subunit [Deltaproteobacteria bacterium]|nr:xanthine dehydrogenase family protein molybdopterin-binding subunit [Deltaproteobacteria bacterium]MBW2417414.1 xanthine dehydrogenase family protein molybdopterin-binding subunit [Deltaproteobacteria bacterium]